MGYLSDVARRRIAAVILVVAVVIAVMALTDSAFFADEPTEEERVADTIREFFASTERGDFKRSCELLAQEAQQEIRVMVIRASGSNASEAPCPELMKVVQQRFADLAVKVKSVNIEGNRARGETALKKTGEPSRIFSIQLSTAEGGGWQIYDLG